MERRVTAVMVADMVGFSRLTEQNEEGTFFRHKNNLKQIMEPAITARKGQMIKSTGDGFIAEFSSVVDALQAAIQFQNQLSEEQSNDSAAANMFYRVAIHVGDVIFDENDVFGDGVNVAARLESIAEPGGIVVSGTAYDILKTNVDVAYNSLGERKLKNIAAPVRVYQVLSTENRSHRIFSGLVNSRIIGGLAALLLGATAIAWFGYPSNLSHDLAIFEDAVDEKNYLIARQALDDMVPELSQVEPLEREQTLQILAKNALILGAETGSDLTTKRIVNIELFDAIKRSGANQLQEYFDEGDLVGLDLPGIDFSQSDFHRTSFSGSFLLNSVFYEARMRNMDFSYSYLRNAGFSGAKITNSDFTGADWFNSIGLDTSQFSLREFKLLEPCPGVFEDFVKSHDERYMLQLHDLDAEIRQALERNWQQITSPGAVCDQIQMAGQDN